MSIAARSNGPRGKLELVHDETAAIVWEKTIDRYLPGDSVGSPPNLVRIHELLKGKPVSRLDRSVLAMTYDGARIYAMNFKQASNDIHDWVHEHDLRGTEAERWRWIGAQYEAASRHLTADNPLVRHPLFLLAAASRFFDFHAIDYPVPKSLDVAAFNVYASVEGRL